MLIILLDYINIDFQHADNIINTKYILCYF